MRKMWLVLGEKLVSEYFLRNHVGGDLEAKRINQSFFHTQIHFRRKKEIHCDYFILSFWRKVWLRGLAQYTNLHAVAVKELHRFDAHSN